MPDEGASSWVMPLKPGSAEDYLPIESPGAKANHSDIKKGIQILNAFLFCLR